MNAICRPVERRDVPEVVAIVRAVLAEFGFVYGVGSPTDVQVESLPEVYTDAGGAFFVAEHDGRIVGTAGVFPLGEPGVFELRKMYVSDAARGQRLGPKLFELCRAHVRAQGGHRIALDTAEGMTTAIALYERLGFVRDDAYRGAERCTRGYRLDL